MAFPDFSLTVLGSRGSMAFGGEQCSRYGGDSSCYMVRAGEETVFLDGGTGICAAPSSYPKDPVVLLTHLHLDHIVGPEQPRAAGKDLRALLPDARRGGGEPGEDLLAALLAGAPDGVYEQPGASGAAR